MMYTRLQNYTNMVVSEHGIQNYGYGVVVWCFVPTSAHPLLILDKWFVQMYLNDNF